MASMVANGNSSSSCSSSVLPLVSVQEKGSRNKRKFRADPPLRDSSKSLLSSQSEPSGYEFSAEKFEAAPTHESSAGCDFCSVYQDQSDGLKFDLGLSSGIGPAEVGTSQNNEELESEEPHDADWSDLTESQLEELVLSNLDAIFKSAIKKIVGCGYTEEVATKAVVRSGLCYGRKDTVSNIVDNTLAFLKNGQEIDPSREHCFEDLQQLEKYILAELVCVLQEVRPFFSTGDAMWCLLICDMNVSHACAMDGDLSNGFAAEGVSGGTSISSQSQTKTEAKSSELNLPSPCKSEPSPSCSHSSQSESTSNMAGIPNLSKSKSTGVLNRLFSQKEGSNSTFEPADKSFSIAGTSQSPVLEEKFIASRKVHSNSSKKEFVLRQKSFHLEKSYRTYGTKGPRAGKLSGLGDLILDKKLKSVSDSAFNLKNASLRLSKVMGVDVPQDNESQNISSNNGPCSPASNATSSLPKNNIMSALPATNTQAAFPVVNTPPATPAVNSPPATPAVSSAPATPAVNSAPAVETVPGAPAVNIPLTLSATDTELSLSLSAKTIPMSVPVSSNGEAPNCIHASFDKPLAEWVPRDKKDEMIMKLVPRARELQSQLQEWTEWANQKVMQAARRLSKDKAELKSLRQEKEEVERLRKEKQTLEENTMKKLTEMENALGKASGQVERANSAVRRLEVENAALRQEMETAKLRAAESAASCQEVSKREKKTLMNFQSWEKQKILLQEELTAEKHQVAQLLQKVEQAKQLHEQYEARWQQEETAKEELLLRSSSIRKEREQSDASAKSKENMIKSKAEKNLQKYREDIQKLEKEISQLRLKTDSSKIAALRRGINESYSSIATDVNHGGNQKELSTVYLSKLVADFHEFAETGGVKRERECVMCLSEEMSVVFLPCAHQVVCTTCNELHEKQGMKDCPSCRSPIQRRIPVHFAHP